MSDRICLMNDGEIVQIGTPDDLYFRPRTVFAADFLGESNILPADVVDISGATAKLRVAGGAIISAPVSEPAKAGASVSFMVRPEALRVLDAADSAPNMIEISLHDAIVAGAVTKLFGTLPDGQEISITQLTASAGQSFEPGTALRIGWAPDRTVVLAR